VAGDARRAVGAGAQACTAEYYLPSMTGIATAIYENLAIAPAAARGAPAPRPHGRAAGWRGRAARAPTPSTWSAASSAYRLNKFLHDMIASPPPRGASWPTRKAPFAAPGCRRKNATGAPPRLARPDPPRRDLLRLEKLGAVLGVSNLHIYAAMRGESLEEKTRNAPGALPAHAQRARVRCIPSPARNATFTGGPAVMPHVKSGRLRALAVSSSRRMAAFPDVPTVAESGYPGFEADQWYGVVAPAGTPAELVSRLNLAINKILALPEVAQQLAGEGAEPVQATPQAFAELIAREIPRWREVVRAGNVRPE
jgi:hypothetical protein